MDNRSQPTMLFRKFEVIDVVKKDALRSVYVARHIYLEKKVLLKTLNTGELQDTVLAERFRREARTLAQLDHPHIIRVLDFGHEGDIFYISFEYFQSLNLRQWYKRQSPSDAQKMRVISQLALGLHHAHQHNIIHRDIKPENILIDENRRVKIADFGLALVKGELTSTAADSIVGTPAYMSPEQIRGETLTTRSDLFSLGIVILELFEGRNPVVGKDAGETLNNILNLKPASLEINFRALPQTIRDLLLGLLKTNVSERRPASAIEITDMLETGDRPAIATEDTEASQQINHSGRSLYKRAVLWILTVVIVIALLYAFRNILVIDKQNSGAPSRTLPSDPVSAIDEGGNDRSKNVLQNKQPSVSERVQESEIKTNETTIKPSKNSKTGKLGTEVAVIGTIFIECQPWAEVFVDSQKFDVTPIEQPLRLQAGAHIIQLKHPEFPVYEREIVIDKSQSHYINVNLDTLAAYVECRVYPWGNVYIDGRLYGQTPLQDIIRIQPGRRRLEVVNPEFEPFTQKFFLQKNDTMRFHIDLEQMGQREE